MIANVTFILSDFRTFLKVLNVQVCDNFNCGELETKRKSNDSEMRRFKHN